MGSLSSELCLRNEIGHNFTVCTRIRTSFERTSRLLWCKIHCRTNCCTLPFGHQTLQRSILLEYTHLRKAFETVIFAAIFVLAALFSCRSPSTEKASFLLLLLRRPKSGCVRPIFEGEKKGPLRDLGAPCPKVPLPSLRTS